MTSRLFRTVALLAILLASLRVYALTFISSQIYFSATATYHASGPGMPGSPPALFMSASQSDGLATLSGTPTVFGVGGPIAISAGNYDGNLAGTESTSDNIGITWQYLSDFTITLQPQPGYDIFINGVHKNVITNNDAPPFNLTLVPLPSGPSAYATGSFDQEPLGSAGSIAWGRPYFPMNDSNPPPSSDLTDWPSLQFNLGLAKNGKPLVPLKISLQPGAGLNGNPVYPDSADVPCNVNGNVQVVTAPQVTATLTFNSSNFQLAFTRPGQTTAFVIYVFTPNGGSMTIAKTMAGSSRVDETDFYSNESGYDNLPWSYDDWHQQGQPVQRHVSLTAESLPQFPASAQIGPRPSAVLQVTDGSGNLATSTQFNYFAFSGAIVDDRYNAFNTCGWLVYSQVEGFGGSNTYTNNYYLSEGIGAQYGQTQPTGSTTFSLNNVWQPTTTFNTWCNQVPQAGPQNDPPYVSISANGSAQTDYVYTNDWNGVATLIHSATTHVGSTLLSQTTNTYDFSQSANGQPLLVTSTAASIDTNGNALTTVTKSYRPDTTDRTYSGLPYSVQKPDGTQTDYAYERGTYNGGGSFSTDPNGPDLRVTTLYGVTLASGGGTTVSACNTATIDSIILIPNRSTEVVDYRQNGLLMRRETYAYDNGGAFELLDYQNFTYTADGRLQRRDYSNGLSEIHNWAGDLETNSTDAEGVITDYGYDSAGRLTSITRHAVGSVPAQTTTYSYDGDNRIVSTAVGSGGEQLITTKQYDTSGHLTGETSSTGVTTTYDYANGGQTVTETHADGGTKVTTYFTDGRVLSITGTAVVSAYHHYDFDGQGRPRHTVYYAADNGSRYQTTITDLLGRVVEKDGPGPNGSQIVAYNTYNSRGQLSRVQTVLRANGSEQPISADQVTSYDAFGAVAATGLDLDNAGLDGSGNATLNSAGNDRFVATSTTLVKDGNGTWWNRVTTQTYAANGSSASNQSQTWTRLSGLTGGVQSYAASFDYYGNATVSTAQVSIGSNLTTNAEIAPDGSSTVQVSSGGLLLAHQELDSGSHVQHTITYGYDAQGRQVSATDSRTGQSSTAYNLGTPLVYTVTDAKGNIVATYGYDSMARVASVTDANGDVVSTSYNTRGQVSGKSGNGTYPVSYGYDDLGRQTSMRTSRAGNGAWDTTTWAYDPGTGWLTQKTDPANQSVTFDYEYDFAHGEKQVIRTWARGVTTTSHYSLTTGDLIQVTYSDTTPKVDYSYNRDGTLATVTDAAGNRGLYYSNGQLSAEDLDPSWYNGLVQTRNYETATDTQHIKGRYSGFMLGYAPPNGPANLDQEMSVAYSYDTLGRLSGVTANYKAQGSRAALPVPFVYGYLAQSGLWNSLTQQGGSFNVSRSFETNRDVLTDIYANWNGTAVTHYYYETNPAGQRSKSTQDGAAFATYGASVGYTYHYDTVGQLNNAAKTLGGTALPGGNFTYNYDWAGNRTSVGVDSESASYSANNLNQVTSRGTLPTRFSGTADANATVTVGSATVTRLGRYWDAEPLGLNTNIQNTQVSVTATLGSQSQSANLWTFERPATESLQYDLDGNLTQDSAWQYSYDAENRLVSMTTSNYAFAAPNAVQTINFAYDYLGRRVRKTVYLNNSLISDRKYIYHGWLLDAEMDANLGSSTYNQITRSYVWGLDASGSSLDGAGGVGGLILETVHTSTALAPYAVGYDGNGNVATLVNTSTGSFGAVYEYDPFGQIMHAEGSEAGNNPFQFSTKYRDRETGLIYYGNRYYDPSMGRFINRDPSEEAGGLNLYGFVGNNPINDWDMLGLDPEGDGYTTGDGWMTDPDGSTLRWISGGTDANGYSLGGGWYYMFGPNSFSALNTPNTINSTATGAFGSSGLNLGYTNSNIGPLPETFKGPTRVNIVGANNQSLKTLADLRKLLRLLEMKRQQWLQANPDAGTYGSPGDPPPWAGLSDPPTPFDDAIDGINHLISLTENAAVLVNSVLWLRGLSLRMDPEAVDLTDPAWQKVVGNQAAIQSSLTQIAIIAASEGLGELAEVPAATIGEGAPGISAAELKDMYPYRTPWRQGVRDAVFDSAIDENGKVFDPFTGREILRNDPWEFGHLPEFKLENWRPRAFEEGWTRAEWNDFINSPEVYRPETRFTNGGHYIENIH